MGLQFRHLLVPVDFGESSDEALEVAIELATRFDSRLTLLHVYEIPAYVYGGMTYATADLFAPIEEAAREHLAGTLRRVQKRLPRATAELRQGAPAVEVLAVVERLRPDLVVMGTHGRQGMRRMLLGSVAEKIVRLSTVPVLTVRGGRASEHGPGRGSEEARS